jgi:effector-binding domain-containing protein
MPESFEIREVPAQTALSLRGECGPGEIGAALTRLYPAVGAEIRRLGGRPAGAPFCRYHAMSDQGFSLEAGMAVEGPAAEGEPTAPVERVTLGGGPCAFAVHVGSYDHLRDTHAALRDWLAANGYESAGPFWEQFIDDPYSTPVETLRTEIYAPVTLRAARPE